MRIFKIKKPCAKTQNIKNCSMRVSKNTSSEDKLNYIQPSEEKYIKVYLAACKFLDNMAPIGVDVNKYYFGDVRNYESLKDIYLRLLVSAQNYNRMPNVIKFEKRIDAMKNILYDFDYLRIKDISAEKLYSTFRKEFNVTTPDTKQNSWYKFSNSVIDAAKFISAFAAPKDLENLVNSYDCSVSARMKLATLISKKIRGIGFALTCDFLKELGFTNYVKPDTHLKEVFYRLGLSRKKDDCATFEAISRMADICKKVDNEITPYKVDKIFYLICSGRFYMENPAEIKIRGQKQELIKYLSEACANSL